MIQRPQLRKTIPGFLRSLWKKEITKKGVAACRQTGCDEQFTNIDQLYDHYSKCNFTPRRVRIVPMQSTGVEFRADSIYFIIILL